MLVVAGGELVSELRSIGVNSFGTEPFNKSEILLTNGGDYL